MGYRNFFFLLVVRLESLNRLFRIRLDWGECPCYGLRGFFYLLEVYSENPNFLVDIFLVPGVNLSIRLQLRLGVRSSFYLLEFYLVKKHFLDPSEYLWFGLRSFFYLPEIYSTKPNGLRPKADCSFFCRCSFCCRSFWRILAYLRVCGSYWGDP